MWIQAWLGAWRAIRSITMLVLGLWLIIHNMIQSYLAYLRK